MARVKSEGKRAAILVAAAKVFAMRGLDGSPTSAICREAGIAEGTLFTYFRTKNELVNVLYRETVQEVASHVLARVPPDESDPQRVLKEVWTAYLDWGISHRAKSLVLAQLKVSPRISADTRTRAGQPFAGVHAVVRKAVRQHRLRSFPKNLMSSVFDALANTTLDLMAADPKNAKQYARWGFRTYWNAIARH
jgi:AcrR family transcriptional regulator